MQGFGTDLNDAAASNGVMALHVEPVQLSEEAARLMSGAAPSATVVPPWVVQRHAVAFKISTTIVVAHSKALSASVAATRAPGGVQRFLVTRTLGHLAWFQNQLLTNAPFCVTAPLPDIDDAHTVDGVEDVTAMLLLLAASSATTNDPLFWSLLTQPDDHFVAQFAALTARSPAQSVMQVVAAAKTKLRARLPEAELKPPAISDMMIETHMIERAFFTMDKISACVAQTMAFDRVRAADKPRLAAWRDAVDRAYDLRDRLDDEAAAMAAVGTAIRGGAEVCFWPWTRARLMAQDAIRPPTLPAPSVVAAAASGGGFADGERPLLFPSQRLVHYHHRVANACRELARADRVAFGGADLLSAVSLAASVAAARIFSASAAHDRFHFTHPPTAPASGRTLCALQDATLHIVEKGRGYAEAEALDQIDDDITAIHDAADAAVAAFETHSRDARAAMAARVLRCIREMQTQQALAWASTALLLGDLRTTLELDTFLDEEDLPFAPLAPGDGYASAAAAAAAAASAQPQTSASGDATSTAAVAASPAATGDAAPPAANARRRHVRRAHNPFDTGDAELMQERPAAAAAAAASPAAAAASSPLAATDEYAAQFEEVVRSQSRTRLLDASSGGAAAAATAAVASPTGVLSSSGAEEFAEGSGGRATRRNGGAAAAAGGGGGSKRSKWASMNDDEDDPFKW